MGKDRDAGFLLNPRDDAAQDEGTPGTVSLPVSKSVLASRLSLTPEYFSRVLRELEDAGMIRVDRRDIHILDAGRLAAYPG